MGLLKKRSTRFYLGFILILAMALGSSAIAAFASGGGTATATLSAGQLTESDTFAPTFPTTQLTGADQTLTKAGGLSMQVTDATGSGAGWRTTITAASFVCQSNTPQDPCFTAGPSNTPATLDPSGTPLSLTNMSAACVAGNGCTAPVSSGTVPTQVYASGTAAPFYSDKANNGLGIINVTADLNLFVPGNTYAGTYKSTVTLAVVSGP